MELDHPSHTESKEPIKDTLQRHCHIEGHLNPNCSREEYVEARDSSSNPIQESESMSDRMYPPQQRPQLSHSKASGEHPKTSKLLIPSLSIQEVDGHSKDSKNSSEKEGFGDRKMSNIDIEKVKLLMSIPSPGGPTTSIMAVHDGDILEFDDDYGVSRISPGLVERTNSHAPLLPHECLTCEDTKSAYHENYAQDTPTSPRHADSFLSESEQEALTPNHLHEFDDPNFEMFPSGAQNILKRMATLHKELPPDETVTLDLESPFDSPARFTKDAPTFAHEMPPIGSPADARRKMSSYDSPDFAIHTGKQ